MPGMSEDRKKLAWAWVLSGLLIGAVLIGTIVIVGVVWIGFMFSRSTVITTDADGNIHATTTVDPK